MSRQIFRTVCTTATKRAIPRVAFTRSFATPSSSDCRPPINLFGVDGTYATALYTAAAKTSTLDPTAKAMENLNDLFKKDAKLTQVLSTPRLTSEDKSSMVAELNKHTGTNVATVKSFLDTLAENNRLGHLQGICKNFSELMSAERGEIKMLITSAERLDSKILSRLESAVSKSSFVGPGKKLKTSNKVDPEIVGGLIVEIGDRTIDLSVSSRIGKMNKLLTDSL